MTSWKTWKMVRLAFMATAVLALLAACGNVGESGGGAEGDSEGGESGQVEGSGDGPEITVGSKNFTEQYILGELYAQALADGGFSVQKELNLGSEQIADQALQSGQIDLYPEYTGTALVSVLGYNEEELAELDTPEATYEEAARLYADRDNPATLTEQADFNNTYGIFVRAEVAEEYGLETLEDLAEVSGELSFVSFSEFQNRSDGYPNMQENYSAMDFGDIVIVNSIGGPIYQGVTQGSGDAGVGFTTDGLLASEDLVVVEDEHEIWPFYYPAPLVNSEVLEENPEMEEILDEVSASLSLATMQDLNAQVDTEQRNPEEVAADFLQEQGLLSGGE